MDLFIAWDGDHIGRKVGQLALSDDEEGLRRVSQAIDAGNRLMAAWVNAALGAMISYGGDEGRARIPATALADVERIRQQYAQAVGSPVSVGVGIRLSESDKALLSAKLRGGDQVMLYGPEVDRDLEQMQERSESEKLGDEYLTKAEKFGQAAFRHKQNGTIIPSGLIHDMDYLPGGEDSVDHFEPGFISKDGQFYTEQQAKDIEGRLKKDDQSAGPQANEAPVNNASAGGGYTPIHEAGGGEPPEPPMQEASEHSQGEAMQSMADETSSPEGSGAAANFESELHDHAKDQDQQDQADDDAKKGKQDARKKVLEILAQIKQAAPQLEQLRDQAPDLYGVLMGMTQALLITSRGLLDDDSQQSDSGKVVEQQGSEDDQSSPDVQKAELSKVLKPDKSGQAPASMEAHTPENNILQNAVHGAQKERFVNSVMNPEPFHERRKRLLHEAFNPDSRLMQTFRDWHTPFEGRPAAHVYYHPASTEFTTSVQPLDGPGLDQKHAFITSNRPGGNDRRWLHFPPGQETPHFISSNGAGQMHHYKTFEDWGKNRNPIAVGPQDGEVLPGLQLHGHTRKAELPPVGLAPPPAAPALHSTLPGFMTGLKALPKVGPERGKFITAHMSHPPFVAALQAHPQGKQIHAQLMGHLNSVANAGFKPGATQVTAKNEDELEKVQSHLNLPVGATKDGKVKVKHGDEKTGWVSVRAGQVLSNDGHPVSSRNPGGH